MKTRLRLPILIRTRKIRRLLPRHLFRKTVTAFLTICIALEQILVPLAYAEQVTPPAKSKEEVKSTLYTDENPLGVDPYIGEGRGVRSVMPSLTDISISNLSAAQALPSRVHRLAKESYRPNEEIKVVIENGLNKTYKTELIDATGNKVAVETDTVETGSAQVITVNQPSAFRPGKYTLRITDGKGGVSEQDFRWGVLAINPDRSVYTPNAQADLAIAVLDEGGNMVCDAQVELKITDPQGKVTSMSTDNKKIIVNPECVSHDFTLKPDYETNYQVGGVGQYRMDLQAQTKNGAFSIIDAFEVRDVVPFDVKRISATRIYPPNAYPVTMEITANQDFEGTIAESVPASFRIAKPGETVKTENEEVDEAVSASTSAESSDPLPASLKEESIQAPAEVAGIQTQAGVLPFSTINNLADITGDERAVLGATIPGLGMPFSGNFPVTQEFSESLVHMNENDLYAAFGMHGHDGVDFGMPIGTQIQAVDGGTVMIAGDNDYGITVIIQHSWGKSYYGHLSGVSVKPGDVVIRGSAIGTSGNSGISTGPHLHFGIKPDVNDKNNGYYGKVDPAYYLGLKQSAGAVLSATTKADEQTAMFATKEGFRQAPLNNVDTDVQILTWKVNVKKGETIKIGYNYLAPRISPQFYTLGPATFTDTSGKEVFHETRKWQIASDALDYKFKRGAFNKSSSATCAAPCTQSVTGVGFKPKAVIFEWTPQTDEANSFTHIANGMGFGTNNSGAVQERAISYSARDNNTTSASFSYRSATKVVVITNGSTGAALAAADLMSFDTDGFTINWTTNDTTTNIIHYTVVGGADVTNAKAGTFSLTTGTGSLAVTDPGFRPDFAMFMSTFTGTADTSVSEAHMNIGFAKSSAKEGAISIFTDNAVGTALTYRQQRTDASILLMTNTTGQDAIADFTSFDANGFTLNKSDGPAANTEIYYLTLQGGQYDVGSFNKPTTTGEQAVTGLGFRPTGIFLASDGKTSGSTAIEAEARLSLGGASKGTADAWCSDTTGITCTSSWSERRKVTFNNAASSENLTNFPVLVKLNSSRIDYSKTQNGGEDIRFVDPSNPSVVLPHEIETWNESGDSFIWVKVPQIDAGSASDSIYMYYNNAAATDGQDVANVWDSSYRAVYHMDESSGTTNADSTANANVGTKKASGEPAATATGVISAAQDFDGSNDYVRAADTNNTLDVISNGTVSVWFNRDGGVGVYQSLVSKGTAATTQSHNYAIQISSANKLDLQLGNATTPSSNSFSTTTTISSTTTDYYGAMTWDGSTIRGYLNGIADGTLAQTITPTANNAAVSIGEWGGNVEYMNGVIDEVRISAVTRSASWLRAEYLSGSDTMNSFGSVESFGSLAPIFSEGSTSFWDDSGATVMETGTGSVTTKAFRFLAEPASGSTGTLAEADLQSFDIDGFTLNWTTADAATQEMLYWATGSVTATQEDYRWFKNANAITPGSALEDENQSTIIAKNKPNARLRANLSVGGNGLNAGGQGFKLQYAAAGSESVVGAISDWCNDTTGVTCTSDWGYRRSVTFNNIASASNLTDFPVLVKLDSSRIDYGKTQNAGEDIRFVDPADPTTVLPHEIESWNESGESFVWVKVPQIDAGSTTDSIWMYYGNSGVADGQDATGVWSNNYNGVWHMDTTSNGETIFSDTFTRADAGTLGGNYTQRRDTFAISGNYATNTTGSIGSAAGTAHISSGLITSPNYSVEAVVNFGGLTASTDHFPGVVGRRTNFSTTDSDGYYAVLNDANNAVYLYKRISGVWTSITSTGYTINNTTDYTVKLDMHGSIITVYVNGVQQLQVTDTSITVAGDAGLSSSTGADPGLKWKNFVVANYPVSDSTINANNGTKRSAAEPNSLPGKVNGSQDFDGTNDNVSIQDAASQNFGASQDFTVGAWVKSTQPMASNVWPAVVSKEDGTTTRQGYNLNLHNSNIQSQWYFEIFVGGTAYTVFGSSDVADGNWHYIVGKRSGSNIIAVQDGSVTNTTAASSGSTSKAIPLKIGSQAGNNNYVDGMIDEVRISNVARSDDWIKAEYLTSVDQMNVYGQEIPYTTGGTSSTGWTDVGDVWCNDTVGVTCNSSWQNRKRITIDNQSSSTALTNFPILVRLDSTRIDYGKTQNNGEDIRFVDPDDPTVVLSHEVESWNESGSSYIWVKVPQIDAKSTSDSIWMYYGNAAVGSPATQLGNATHATSTWDSNTTLVQHMEETASCGTSIFTDSTANAFTGSCNGGGPTPNASGKIGGARSFNSATPHYITIPDNSAFDPTTTAFGVSMWINVTNPSTFFTIMQHMDGGSFPGWQFYVDTGTCGGGTLCFWDGTNAVGLVSGLQANTWTHVAFMRSGTTVIFYINGVAVASRNVVSSIANVTNPVSIGYDNAGNVGGIPGAMDEVRYYATNRSADWMKAEYQTQIDQMNTFGAEETQTTSLWKFKDNSNVTNGATITTGVLGTSTAGNQMTYQEANPTSLIPTALAVGEKREFDFSLDGTLTSNRRTYYFRLVNADGTPLTNYSRYPSITVGVPNQKVMRGGKFFNYKASQPFSF